MDGDGWMDEWGIPSLEGVVVVVIVAVAVWWKRWWDTSVVWGR